MSEKRNRMESKGEWALKPTRQQEMPLLVLPLGRWKSQSQHEISPAGCRQVFSAVLIAAEEAVAAHIEFGCLAESRRIARVLGHASWLRWAMILMLRYQPL